MASLDQFLNSDLNADDVSHSSGYIGAGGAGGGAGGLSMDARRKLLNQPRVVGSYTESQLGRRFHGAKARTADQTRGRVYDPNTESFADGAKFSNRQKGGIGADKVDASIAKRQHFVEPSARPKPQGYNPYA